MTGQLRLLNLACASKARPRTVTLTRATREEILYFQILGGMERGCGIFIKKVERDSKAFEAGLKRGDQVYLVYEIINCFLTSVISSVLDSQILDLFKLIFTKKQNFR